MQPPSFLACQHFHSLAGCAVYSEIRSSLSPTLTSSSAAGLPSVQRGRTARCLSCCQLSRYYLMLQLAAASGGRLFIQHEWLMLWLALPQPGQAPTPQRPSQIVHESTVPGETGQHAVIKMERVYIGGTRYVQQFRRQQADGPMTAAERAAKKRVRASLSIPAELCICSHTRRSQKTSGETAGLR